MVRATDRLKAQDPPAGVLEVEESAELFLAGIHEAFNDPDDKRLAATIRRLEHAPESLKSAIALYESRPDDSAFRWGVVYLASRVGSSGTVEWLTRVALDALPDRPKDDAKCESARDGEVLVRVMAVEGLGSLDGRDHGSSIGDALTKIITNQPDPAVVSAAVVQLREVDPAAARRIVEVLPDHHKHLVDVELKRDPTEVDRRPESLGLDPGESSPPPSAQDQEA